MGSHIEVLAQTLSKFWKNELFADVTLLVRGPAPPSASASSSSSSSAAAAAKNGTAADSKQSPAEVSLPAHRTVLAFHSPIFAQLLLPQATAHLPQVTAAVGVGVPAPSSPVPPASATAKELVIEKTDPLLFEQMIKFMYTVRHARTALSLRPPPTATPQHRLIANPQC
jgi:hypothetical protein